MEVVIAGTKGEIRDAANNLTPVDISREVKRILPKLTDTQVSYSDIQSRHIERVLSAVKNNTDEFVNYLHHYGTEVRRGSNSSQGRLATDGGKTCERQRMPDENTRSKEESTTEKSTAEESDRGENYRKREIAIGLVAAGSLALILFQEGPNSASFELYQVLLFAVLSKIGYHIKEYFDIDSLH